MSDTLKIFGVTHSGVTAMEATDANEAVQTYVNYEDNKPTAIKYIWTDVDGEDAWDVNGYKYAVVDGEDVADGKFRLWVQTDEADTTFTFGIKTGGIVSCHINWGDGEEEDVESSGSTQATAPGISFTKNVSHVYDDAGVYVVIISSIGNLIGVVSCQNNQYLKAVEVASYVTKWFNTEMYSGCPSLEMATFPASLTDITETISTNVLSNCASLKKVVFRSNRTKLPSFQNCTSLEEFHFPQYVVLPSTGLFYGCTKLKNVIGLENTTITELGQDMFRGCTSLKEVLLPGTLTSTRTSSFAESGLEKIIIPALVTELGYYLFDQCASLTEVHMLPTTPPTIGGAYFSPFKNTPANMVIYVPYSSDHSILSAYQSATNWSTYASQIQEEP